MSREQREKNAERVVVEQATTFVLNGRTYPTVAWCASEAAAVLWTVEGKLPGGEL